MHGEMNRWTKYIDKYGYSSKHPKEKNILQARRKTNKQKTNKLRGP
jgi:hypothetical protein